MSTFYQNICRLVNEFSVWAVTFPFHLSLSNKGKEDLLIRFLILDHLTFRYYRCRHLGNDIANLSDLMTVFA